jgi:hypothetical protein
MEAAGLSTRALRERRMKDRHVHQHITRPQEVKAVVLKRERFDVSLHEGHPVAHAFLRGSGPPLLDVKPGQVKAHDSAAKAPGQLTAVIASAAADIEDERGGADSTGRGDLVEHTVRTWVQAFIQWCERTAFVAGPHMRIKGLHLRFALGHGPSPSASGRHAPLVMCSPIAHRGLAVA